MKRKRWMRNAGLVALSAVLVGGAAMAFTACGKGGRDGYTLSVYIFCGEADSYTNEKICLDWAEEYSAAHSAELGGNKIKINFRSEPDKPTYFDDMADDIGTSRCPDIIYVSPAQTLTYAGQGHILDLTDYILADQAMTEAVGNVWKDSLAFYAGYGTAPFLNGADSVEYDAQRGAFYDAENDKELRFYGLPKDYSSFGLGYNRNYFDDVMKAAYTTLKPSSGSANGRSVTTRLYAQSGPVEKAGNRKAPTHEGKDTASITYAVDVDGVTNKYTGAAISAKAGDPASFINVGIPTRYKPFNFYRYATFQDALREGDPLAVSTQSFTGGQGYIITIPGFPGETFSLTDNGGERLANTVNDDAEYDAENANLVLTYTEYGALNWACAYLLNSFSWDDNSDIYSENVKDEGNIAAALKAKTVTENTFSAWFKGRGGVYTAAGGNADNHDEIGDFNNVYGGEQNEWENGQNLYILPWLFSNDAVFINESNEKSINEKRGDTVIASKNANNDWSWTSATSDSDIFSRVGTASERISKINLDGTEREALVQYGINSENFIETYGAFQEYSATWNAHYGEAGDTAVGYDKGGNGQGGFVSGASIFYGVGTWDVSEYQEVHRAVLDLGVMPTAVSNKLSLYAQSRSAYYYAGETDKTLKAVTYANGATQKGTGVTAGTATGSTGDYTQRTGLNDGAADTQAQGLKVYTEDEIAFNQALRQDKWAGRMDSVGYAVNGKLTEDAEWVAPAAASLVMALTIGEQAQVTLTYAGAQIPNVMSQCNEYLNYNTTAKDGAFKDMITPEGDAEGHDVWDAYYEVALEMASANNSKTVKEFLAGKQIEYMDEQGQKQTIPLEYDTQYDGVKLSEFSTATTSKTRIAYAMRVLRMINYTRAERDILIRMVTGMNAVKDQTLYTQGTRWINTLNADGSASSFLAYINQVELTDAQKNYTDSVAFHPSQVNTAGRSYMTPAVFAVRQALASQNYLSDGQ